MGNKRIEKDLLGTKVIADESLPGIHSLRAVENFGLVGGRVNSRLLCAFGMVKLACVRINRTLGYIQADISIAIEQACLELADDKLQTSSVPAALQGGAGTSTNMFVNELLANRALQILGKTPGSYEIISPLDHVNLHQSTNDTYPTSLRVAAIWACIELEQAVSSLVDALQRKEQELEATVRIARTQLQDAVLTTLGRQFGAYAEAFSKDRWRISKCVERLRVINLGGTAIGTGLGAPKKYIFKICEELRKLTDLPLARAENLVQATQNCDDFVEVSGILKTLASNMMKISSDIRLLSSGPRAGFGEISLPPMQAGSSIMPGKVNPVIAEMVGQVAIQAVSRDSAITLAAMNGQLELNAFMPLIAHNLLCMIDELTFAATKFRTHLIEGIKANEAKCKEAVDSSTAVITAFIHKIGYEKATEIARRSVDERKTVKELLLEANLCTEQEFKQITSPDAVLALGFRSKNNECQNA
jgi:aspartate ammonia-lyase